MIQIGLFLNTNYLPGDNHLLRFREALEQVRVARDHGFASIAVGQHFLTGSLKLQPVPMLARLATESGDMRLVTGILLLPLFNPVDVAEQIASLDVITEGRLIFGVGVGYRDIEFEAFGVQKTDRAARFAEALALIKRLWTEEEVEHQGRFFRVPRVRPATRPLQRPHPPIWVAAQNDAGVRRAAEAGDVLFMNPQATIITLARQAGLYREALRAAGRPVPSELAGMKEVYIAPTMDEAVREGAPYLEEKLKMYAGWGQLKELPPESAKVHERSIEELCRDPLIVGDPEHCVAEFKRYRDQVGINHFSVVLNWPGMSQWQVLRSIQLMGERVLPALRAL